jgi:hypothetical protein
VSEFVPGYESSAYFGFGAPGKTPTKIVGRLNREINAGLADPKLKAQLSELGGMTIALPISGPSLPKRPKSGAR